MSEWQHVGRSLTGAAHQRQSRPCQDRWTFMEVKPAVILTVIDGAGGCSRASEGADLAEKTLGPDLAAWCGGKSPLFASSDITAVSAELTPVLTGAMELFVSRCEKAARQAGRDTKAGDFSVSATAVIACDRWLACITQGDVGCVEGVPGNWNLVNRIFKCTPRGERGPRRNATNLMPWGTNQAPICSFFPRAPGRMIALFSDGALSRFLVDTSPSADVGTYVVSPAQLDTFDAGIRPQLWPKPNAAASPKSRHGASPQTWFSSFIDEIQRAGEEDDITVLAACDKLPSLPAS